MYMVHNTTSADVKRVYERYIIKSEALISELLEVGGLEGNPDDLVRVLLKHTLGGYDITFALGYDKDIFELTDLCLRGVVTKKLKPKIERVPIEYVEYKRKGRNEKDNNNIFYINTNYIYFCVCRYLLFSIYCY